MKEIKGVKKEVFGVLRITLMFMGILMCLFVALPLAPFLFFYFLYDRKKKHQELKLGLRSTNRIKPKFSDWRDVLKK
jgi:multidrug efflux pump subunit AcrB